MMTKCMIALAAAFIFALTAGFVTAPAASYGLGCCWSDDLMPKRLVAAC